MELGLGWAYKHGDGDWLGGRGIGGGWLEEGEVGWYVLMGEMDEVWFWFLRGGPWRCCCVYGRERVVGRGLGDTLEDDSQV